LSSSDSNQFSFNRKKVNWNVNIDGAIGIDLLIKNEQMMMLEKKKNSYSVVRRKLDDLIN
jgi:hypothetical protein